MSPLALYLLGPPRIELDGKTVSVRRRKALALLAYLAVTGRSYRRDSVATLLWPELDQSKARAGLRSALSSLNTRLGAGWLEVDRESVAMDHCAGAWLDVEAFQARLAESRVHGHNQGEVCPRCLATLAGAADLYRDDFLAGFTLSDSPAFDDWQFFQTEGLREELAWALERLARGCATQGAYEKAVPYARRWVALDPLHESAQRGMMQLYAWAGQRAAALRQYAECARVLQEELGTRPEAETTALFQSIKAGRQTALPAKRAPDLAPTIPPRPRHNLPVQLTSFIGRETLLAEIAERLDDPECRLLTLVGPGGCGKTRLALEAAVAKVEDYEHGVFFVALAPLESAEVLVPTVAKALGFTFYQGPPPRQQLLDYLRAKHMLLAMDNFEHLLAPRSPSEGGMTGVVDLVTEMLHTAPRVKILATSRVKLNAEGEEVFQVRGMDFPHADAEKAPTDYSAVKLFLDRAQRAQRGFETTVDDLGAVGRICDLVEGMPLGIELAAAWVDALALADIADEIQRSLDFLETDRRDVPERQRSMRAMFDHSWRLLSAREQKVLAALSVFRGGFTRRAAERVAGATLRELKGLVDKSLVQRATAGRYELHGLLHQYADEQLQASPGVATATLDRHCAYYAGFLERRAKAVKGPRQMTAVMEIEEDIENARRAWNWATEREQLERLYQALEGLCLFWEWRARFKEGETTCRLAAEKLALTAAADGLQLQFLAWVTAWQGVFSWRLGRTERAGQLLRNSLALFERPTVAYQQIEREKAFTLFHLAQLMRLSGELEEARRLAERSQTLYRAAGDQWGTAASLAYLGRVAMFSGAYEEAQRLLEESLATRQRLGDGSGIADSLYGLGQIAFYDGHLEESLRLYRESIAARPEIEDYAGTGLAFTELGLVLTLLGNVTEARAVLEQYLTACTESDFKRGTIVAKNALAGLEFSVGNYKQARACAETALSMAQAVGYAPDLAWSLRLLGGLALVSEEYAEAERLLQESATIFGEIVLPAQLIFSLADLAGAAFRLGKRSKAQRHLSDALRWAVETRTGISLPYLLPGIAIFLAEQGEQERAVELYTLVSRHPVVTNTCFLRDVASKHIGAAAATLPPDVVEAAQEHGRARDLWATAHELLAEFESEIGSAGRRLG